MWKDSKIFEVFLTKIKIHVHLKDRAYIGDFHLEHECKERNRPNSKLTIFLTIEIIF